MDEKKRSEIVEKAMHEAGEALGADPAYFGKEGEEEIDKQIFKLGYNPEDFKK